MVWGVVSDPGAGPVYASLHQTFEQQHKGSMDSCRASRLCVSECGVVVGKATGRPFHRRCSEDHLPHNFLCWPHWHCPVGNTSVNEEWDSSPNSGLSTSWPLTTAPEDDCWSLQMPKPRTRCKIASGKHDGMYFLVLNFLSTKSLICHFS